MHHPFRPPLAWALALAAALLLGACRAPTPPVDPLTVATSFAFAVTNPDGLTGPVYGVLVRPFEEGGLLRADVGPPSLEFLLNAFAEATLDADGEVSGTLIAPSSVPRINESLGIGIGPRLRRPSYWWAFFPPAGCPVTAVNPNEAALAPVIELLVWDGETVDDAGYPAVDGAMWLGSFDVTEDDGVQTAIHEGYLLVASRAAWSATSGGPCTVDERGSDVVIDIDLDLDVGWQFLYYRSVERYDGMDWSLEETVRTVALADAADLGPLGEAEARSLIPDVRAAALPIVPSALARLFR